MTNQQQPPVVPSNAKFGSPSPKPEIDELVKARRSGATINALAAQFGIHHTTVMEYLRRKVFRVEK